MNLSPVTKISYSDLSRTVSHALRHEPWLYELELDDDGWVSIDCLLCALKPMRPEWAELSIEHLQHMIKRAGKQRHQMNPNHIRALYGHTLPEKLHKTAAQPPSILYHGTAPQTAMLIKKSGLQPMQRQYVHASIDPKMAQQVGLRKSPQPVILTILAAQAYNAGIGFYRGNDRVWLCDTFTPEFLQFPDKAIDSDHNNSLSSTSQKC
jgi:putative RNA 2'-phosphotransferase